tara:strand:- start:60130 stop:62139 length:2010 start_codon:yes stop_codon:yes gene_type:complete
MGDDLRRPRAVAFALIAFMLTSAIPYSQVAAEVDAKCCETTEFDLYLLGSADDGTLSPFESDLDEEFEKLVTPSVQGLVEIGKWSLTWGLQGDYPDADWEFRIPYEVEAAAGIQINATVGINIGNSYFEGDAGAGFFLANSGEVVITIPVEVGEVRDGDKVELTFSVRSLSFSSPGDDAGIRFVWGSDSNTGRISMKFPLIDIDMKDASVTGRLVYFPVLLKSGFASNMWSSSIGGMSVASNQISDSPISTPNNNGVEVTFVWEIPETTDSGNFQVVFHIIPQTGLRIEANRTFQISAGDNNGGGGSWYPAAEPLRTGGTSLNVDIDAKFDGEEVERVVIIEFDGAMSQWVRWGLDNIGNNSLSSNSWWRNLRTYGDDIPSSDFHNGRVDDSELAALQSHLIGSATDMKSFMSNGLSLDIEALLGVNPANLGPTDITIDLGQTRAFSSEGVKITIDTSNSVETGQRQILIETFVKASQEEYYDEINLDVEIRSSALQGFGGMANEDIDAKHRRWIMLEIISINIDNLDTEKTFRVEFVPTGSALYSPLVSAMISMFMLVMAFGLGLFLTRRRSRVPSMLTVMILGGLSLSLYVLGLDIPFVLGVVSSSMLLVFPVALVSPRTDRRELSLINKESVKVKCPSCDTPNLIESQVRPIRIPCEGCESILRLE